jgi:hypothetical protein
MVSAKLVIVGKQKQGMSFTLRGLDKGNWESIHWGKTTHEA